MKRLLSYLKTGNFQVPLWIGHPISYIPYSLRPGVGEVYSRQKLSITNYQTLNAEQRETFVYNNFYKIFEHAYLSVPFYTRLYKSAGIELGDIRNFESIARIPVIGKKDLIDVPLEERSYPVKGRLIVNTGGSSGKTLSFYTDPFRFGNEWAHIHYMWSMLGFKPSSLKLSFDGRSKVKDYVQYDFLRHSLRFDIYTDKFKVSSKLLEICRRNKIEYLHGYPSAMYEFAIHCINHEPILLKILRSTLQGAFLSSEYPSPHYRDTIESVFGIRTQSFYGHTETCVMAVEKEKFIYEVFQTYGLAEAVQNKDGKTDLVGTSYFNYASPLIRYNTEDDIAIHSSKNGLLESFMINEGRNGDFIKDKNGINIPLTGLIFGRHHKLFDLCEHIQVREDGMGKATILYTSNMPMSHDLNSLFDSSNVDIEFRFEKIDKPVLTNAGKITLLIKNTKL